MHRQVVFDLDDPEGVTFDHSRAVEEGLFETVEAFLQVPGYSSKVFPVSMDEERIEALQRMLDLGVNIGPGEEQVVTLEIHYTYNYGKTPKEDTDAI